MTARSAGGSAPDAGRQAGAARSAAQPVSVAEIVPGVVRRMFRLRHHRGDDERAREKTRVRVFDASKTQQGPTSDCDINVLVRRFGIDKEPPPLALLDPSQFGEFDDSMSLADALGVVNHARNLFMQLPPQLRERFGNEPAVMWEFVNDPKNAEEAVRIGLLRARSPQDARSPSGPPPGNPPAPKAPEAPSGA